MEPKIKDGHFWIWVNEHPYRFLALVLLVLVLQTVLVVMLIEGLTSNPDRDLHATVEAIETQVYR